MKTKGNGIDIRLLRDLPEYAPILAFWSYREWYMERDITFDVVLKAYKARASGTSVPLSFCAVTRALPVGMVSLKRDDLWNRKDLNPWLASLYVVPEFRNRGIAGSLMQAVITEAAGLGLDTLYLFLGRPEINKLRDYYVKRGWVFFDHGTDNDGGATEIYSYSLSGKGR